jgi:hypothetical protein
MQREGGSTHLLFCSWEPLSSGELHTGNLTCAISCDIKTTACSFKEVFRGYSIFYYCHSYSLECLSFLPMFNPSSEAQQGSAPPKSVYECQGCGYSSPGVSYCSICGLSLCDSCWDGQLVHRPGFTRPRGKAHEKIDPLVAQQINNVFSGAQDVSISQQLHSDDEKSAWFGTITFSLISTTRQLTSLGRHRAISRY